MAGDTNQQAASRELFEELGIHYNFEKMRPQFYTIIGVLVEKQSSTIERNSGYERV
ncbi:MULTISPECIES: hypothetical protein [Lysinibacillus]|uniref:hypothetical protein n=1 Tax=Lysinibacillus TaxID=400634 RepID=UPI001EE6EBC4|nr:hypothetical protein [Lysinibacillus tabacifolii]